jgi:ABC-type nitrate/sulfonate/bicarbonate transport system substrate-binding protein
MALRIIVRLAFLLGLALAACMPSAGPAGEAPAPSTPEAARPMPLRVAGSGISGNMLTPWAAYEGGFFEKHGLLVEGIPDIASSTTAVQTLLARDIDVINIAPNAAIEASLKGGVRLVAIANAPPGTGFWLYAAPEIPSVEALRGKRIGANQVGSSTYYAVEYVLREHGLQIGRDVEVLSVGNQPAQLAALQQGHVQAAVLSAPTTARARRAGFAPLLDLNTVPYNANGPVVRRELLEEPAGRDLLLRYLKAYVEAIAHLRQDRAFAYQVLQKYLQTDDPEVLEEVYSAYLPKRVPLVVPEGVRRVLEDLAARDPAALSAAPEQFYDNSLIEELERSGFIGALYR